MSSDQISALLLEASRRSGDYPVQNQFEPHATQCAVLVLIAYLNPIDRSPRCTIITVIMCLAHCDKQSSIVVSCRLESPYQWSITGMDEHHSSTDNQSANSDWNASLGSIPADNGIVGRGSLTHDVKNGASQGQIVENGIEQSPSGTLGESKHAAYTLGSDDSRVHTAAEADSAAVEQQHAADRAADSSPPSAVHLSADRLSMLSLQEGRVSVDPVSESHNEHCQKQPQDAAANEACGQADPASIQLDGLASSEEPPLPAEHPASAEGCQLDGHRTDVYSSVAASESLAGQESGSLQEAATSLQGAAAATDPPVGHETGLAQESASPTQAAAATRAAVSEPKGNLQGAAGSSQGTAADVPAKQDACILHSTAGLPEDNAASSAELPAAAALHDMQQHQPGLQSQSSAGEAEKMKLHASSIIPAHHSNPEGAASNPPVSAVYEGVHALGLEQ